MIERRRKFGLLLLGLVPCIAALLVRTSGQAAVPLPARFGDSPLMFSQYGVSLGDVGPHPSVEAYFSFRNTSDRPVTVTEMKPSCGCVRCSLHGNQKTFQPGEFGRITVNMQTANVKPGPQHYTIQVASNDGTTDHVESLSFRVTLPDRKVAIEPNEVIFYQLHGQADERVVHVADYRGLGRSFSVTGAFCHSKQLDVEVLPQEVTENGQARTPVRLIVPAHVAEGREVTHVWITTTDPDYPRLAVPVLIQGHEPRTGSSTASASTAGTSATSDSTISQPSSEIQQVSGSVVSDDRRL